MKWRIAWQYVGDDASDGADIGDDYVLGVQADRRFASREEAEAAIAALDWFDGAEDFKLFATEAP